MILSCDSYKLFSHAPLAVRPCRAFLRGTVAGRSLGIQNTATMKTSYIDQTGKTFGRLTVISKAPSRKNWQTYWLCRCVCGKEIEASTQNLNRGGVKSCGCLALEIASKVHTTHGHTSPGGSIYSPTYNSWRSMRQRCSDKNHKGYKNYGGRGIKVCERWQNSFENFLADMGVRPEGCTIDRKRVNEDYKPDNCKWSTTIEQIQNRRHSGMIHTFSDLEILNEAKRRNLFVLERNGGLPEPRQAQPQPMEFQFA